MTTKAVSVRRWASIGMLAVLGAAIALAAWVGGEPYLALMLGGFYLACCIGAYVWSRGRGDAAAIMRMSGDERQQGLDLKSTAAAGAVTLAFCVGGTVVDLARGGTGNPWALICAVGGVSYLAAFAYFRRA